MKHLFILIVLAGSAFFKEIDTDLRTVHVIFRHGIRYPKSNELYPNDPYLHQFSENLFSRLTDKGKKSSYGLGQFLRQRYSGLIDATYDKDIIQAKSTATNRTIMTAQLVLAGLFQNSIENMLKENFDWSELPYQIEQVVLDNTYTEAQNCKKFINEFFRIANSSDYFETLEKYEPLFKFLTNHTGLHIKDFFDSNKIYQGLSAEESMELTLPKWTQKIYPHHLDKAAAMLLNFINYNNVLTRLNGGKLLSIILENMLTHINDQIHEKQPKMFLMSGHDRTVASVLAALNVFNPHIPKFNSAVIFELHQDKNSNQYLIKIFYLKGVDQELDQLLIEKCPGFCKLENFINSVKPRTVLNYELECNA